MSIEELYQTIGHLAMASAPAMNGKVLVYAEVEEGVVESGMFYEQGANRKVVFRFCPNELENALYELWERWQEVPGNRPWFGMAYLVRDGRMQIDLTYPDELIENEGTPQRRPRLVKKYFGEVEVDFSKPNG